MRIAINGIGIAGPTLAWWLRHYGHEPVLYERAPALRTGGYLIDFWGLGYEIAERMGIIGTVRDRAYEVRRMDMVDANGRVEASVDLQPARDAMEGRYISIARSELGSALFTACDGIPAHFGVSITEMTDADDGATVTLSDGSHERYDLVVGADGLHSRIRKAAFGDGQQFEEFLDCCVAAFEVAGYPQRDDLVYVSHTEVNRHAARMSLRNDRTLVLFVWRSERLADDLPLDGRKAAIRGAFASMGWETPALLDAMDATDDLYLDRVSQIHLPRWWSGRTVLVGDAAACPSLLAGEGTGVGMTEAYVLAGELHRAGKDVAKAFIAYQDRLYDFVTAKQKGAIWFRGFFAPRTHIGAWVRRAAVAAFALPVLARPLMRRSFQDDFVLPEYG